MVGNEDTLKSIANVSTDADLNYNKAVNQFQNPGVSGEKESFTCEICRLSLQSWDALDKHLRALHVVESNLKHFSCGSCQEEFKRIATLMMHLRRYHTLRKIIFCSKCGEKLPFQGFAPTRYKTSKPLKLFCGFCEMAQPKAGNNGINYKNSKNAPNVKKSTLANTKKHFENKSLEERGIFSKEEKVNGRKNIANDVKIVSIVGSSYQCVNRNFLTKVNSCFRDSIREGSMTTVAAGKRFGIATSNLENGSGGHSEKKKNLTKPSIYCIDFQKGSTVMVSGNHHIGVATSLQITNSKKLASVASMTMATRQKREEHTGNEKVLTEVFFKEGSVMSESEGHSGKKKALTSPNACCVDFQKCATHRVLSNQHLGVEPNILNTNSKLIVSIANMKMIPGKEREEPTGNEKDFAYKFFQEHSARLRAVPLQPDVAQGSILEKNVSQSGSRDVDVNGEDRSFLCKICCLSFSIFKVLEDHLRCSHVVENEFHCFKCGSCNKEFQVLSFLMTHLLSYHAEAKIYSCGECRTRFPYPHSTTARGNSKLYCGRCQTVLNDAKSQKLKSGTFGNPRRVINTHSCEFCQEVFSLKRDLHRHLRISHTVKPYACKLCGKRYGLLKSLKGHFLTHGAEPRKLKMRQPPIETKEKSYACKICGKQFDMKSSLLNHSRTHILKYSCDLCEKIFSNKHLLCSHRRQHKRENPQSCDICKKKHNTEICLNKINSNPNKNAYSCSVCRKVFKRIAGLRAHSSVHTGYKPHSCDVCESKFSTRRTLKLHLLTHSGEKPHSCEICGRAFTRREHLKTHFRVHTGEKPYVCDICQRGFSQKWVMYTHRRTHTGEKPFECEFCQRGFIYKSQLKTHLLKHAENEYEINCQKTVR